MASLQPGIVATPPRPAVILAQRRLDVRLRGHAQLNFRVQQMARLSMVSRSDGSAMATVIAVVVS